MHVRRRQAFIQVQQNLDRVVARIDRRAERFPVGFSLTNELRLRCVARNKAIKSCNRETRVAKKKEKEQKDRRVGAAGQSKSLLPFAAFNQVRPPLPPTVRQEIEFNGRGRRFDSHQLSWRSENTLNGIAKFVTAFIEQHVWKRSINTLQLRTHSQLRQFHLQLLRRGAVECPCETDLAIFGDGRNQRLAFGINEKRATLRRVCSRALRGVNGDLARDDALIEQRRGDFGQSLVPHRNRRNHTLGFVLLDQFEIGRHFLRRKWERFLDLNPDHLRKFRRIDRRQSKSLRQDNRNRQTQDEIVVGGQERHGFVERLQQTYIPRAVTIARTQKIPAVCGRRDEDRFCGRI